PGTGPLPAAGPGFTPTVATSKGTGEAVNGEDAVKTDDAVAVESDDRPAQLFSLSPEVETMLVAEAPVGPLALAHPESLTAQVRKGLVFDVDAGGAAAVVVA